MSKSEIELTDSSESISESRFIRTLEVRFVNFDSTRRHLPSRPGSSRFCSNLGVVGSEARVVRFDHISSFGFGDRCEVFIPDCGIESQAD